MADVKSTKTKKPAKEATHPKYSEMISTAIETLKERGGSSRVAIIKFITSKYKVSDNPNVVNANLKLALKRGVESGSLTQVKGTGASGSFKLVKKSTEKTKVTKSTKSPKKDKAKKAAAKKPKTVKSAKKVPKSKKVAKSPKKSTKSPKKVAKPKLKKTATEKPTQKVTKSKAKKPADKKPAKK